ncbi:MAG TPA: family 16 glycosylhydrolase [Bacteroidales bacterium]|nr:family 16 glycosylhydrolase [Bacteroidales bacterium]
MKKPVLISMLFTCGLCSAQEYQMVWNEEFNRDGRLDSAVWNYENGFERNEEAQWYQPDNAYCKDGHLVIEARKEHRRNPLYEAGNNNWRKNRKFVEYTSASVTTAGKKEFRYGRFEVRAKIPTAGGAWPAIWTLGSGMPWPSCGEIDIMEYYRILGVPHILANVAWGKDRPYDAEWNSKKIPFSNFTNLDPKWADKFHVWRMDWDEAAIKLFLDDELLNEVPLSTTVNGSIGKGTNPFYKPQYLLLNLAIGGANGGAIDDKALPMKYEIDYVRVYQRSAPQPKDTGAYLFVFFDDPTHSLFMALSKDGNTFTAINNGKPVIGGDTIANQKGIRDPHISRGPDGAFYLAMTDLHLFAQQKGYRSTTWERDDKEYGWGNNRGFVLMKSFDLIHWTRSNVNIFKDFPELNVGCAWAPETIYDPVEGKMMIYFTMRLGNGRTKLYYAYTDNAFSRLISVPRILFEYPNENVQILDADIIRMPTGRYCMTYVAQEKPGGIKMAFSDSIHSGFQYNPEWIDTEPGACEAPNMWKRSGEDKWVLMYDIFSIQPHNFGFCETTDFRTFKNLGHFNEGVMKLTNFVSPKHGAIISLTNAEAQKLADYWNFDMNF